MEGLRFRGSVLQNKTLSFRTPALGICLLTIFFIGLLRMKTFLPRVLGEVKTRGEREAPFRILPLQTREFDSQVPLERERSSW